MTYVSHNYEIVSRNYNLGVLVFCLKKFISRNYDLCNYKIVSCNYNLGVLVFGFKKFHKS